MLKLAFKRDLVFAKSVYHCSLLGVSAIFNFSVFVNLYNHIINRRYEQNVMEGEGWINCVCYDRRGNRSCFTVEFVMFYPDRKNNIFFLIFKVLGVNWNALFIRHWIFSIFFFITEGSQAPLYILFNHWRELRKCE